MAYSDLREFIAVLEKNGELKRVSAEVDPILEITEVADRAVKSGGPALLFEKPKGYDIPVLINAFAGMRKMELALQVDSVESIAARIAEYLEMKTPQGMLGKLKMLPKLAEMGSFFPREVKNGPVKEVIRKDDFSLFDYPILKCWPQDGGRFITLPLVFSRNPVTGKRNVGVYRLQIFDERTTAMHWQTHKQGAEHYRRALAEGKEARMEVAVAVGSDPATMFSGILPLPPDLDEMLFAGFLRSKPVELVKCETVDLEVPANAEIVLEGYVTLGELRTEGPFGDHTGFYSLEDEFPVFHVTCITQRKDPIYATTIVGPPPMEDYYMGKTIERVFFAADAASVTRSCGYVHAGRGDFPQLDDRVDAQVIPTTRAQGHECHLGLGSGNVYEVHCRGRPRCQCPGPKGSHLEGVEQHRPPTRHPIRDGPDRPARPFQPPAQLWFEDGHRRHPQMERRRVHATLARFDRDGRRNQKASGCDLGAVGNR